MKNLFQRNWYTEVRRCDDRHLIARTSYLDTKRETAAQLLIDTHSFIIEEAILEEQRSPETICFNTRLITPLLGTEAHISSGPRLKEAAAFLNDHLAVALFSETIKGIIQAERFVFKERGYSSIEEFYSNWLKYGLDSCRFFSNLDRVVLTSKYHFRPDGNLFVRFKTQNLFSIKEDQFLLTGNFSDSFHETNVSFKLNGFIVEEADGGFLRAPNPVCRETEDLLSNLHGIDLRTLSKKDIAVFLGKGQGCVHMIDLVNDCAQMLELLILLDAD